MDIIFNPHIDVEENFNSNLGRDPFKWIPKGLMEDLMDNIPGEFVVNDPVSGFTISQVFNALQSDVGTVPQYRARLITQNPNTVANSNLSTKITTLFASYHY